MREITARLVDAGFPLTMKGKGEYESGRCAHFDAFDKWKVDIEQLEND